MNTYDQVRLYGFRRLGTKVRLTNSLEMAITTKVNQGKLFLADIKTQNLLGDGQRRYYGMDEKPTRTWINEKNFRKTSFGITESQTCTSQCLHFVGSFRDVDVRGGDTLGMRRFSDGCD